MQNPGPNRPSYILTTARLGLRRWLPSDLDPFAELNGNPLVREFFPSLLTREQSGESIKRFETHFDQHGYTFYAVDVLETGEFIGFTGLLRLDSFEAWFTPCVEIGWRLRREAWGRGYAPEAAQACLSYAWNTLKLDKVYAYTAERNAKSRRVMAKLGMTLAGQFDHPKLESGHPLQRHVVFEIQPGTR